MGYIPDDDAPDSDDEEVTCYCCEECYACSLHCGCSYDSGGDHILVTGGDE